MLCTPKQMDSLNSRSSAPDREIELVRARSAGASDAHLECPRRDSNAFVAGSRRCLMKSFELLGFRHNRCSLTLEHLAVDQADTNQPPARAESHGTTRAAAAQISRSASH